MDQPISVRHDAADLSCIGHLGTCLSIVVFIIIKAVLHLTSQPEPLQIFTIPHLGSFSFASAGRALRSTTQVEVDSTHECAVAAVSERRHHQAGAVPKVLIPILHLGIHHAHWNCQILGVIVQVLAGKGKCQSGMAEAA